MKLKVGSLFSGIGGLDYGLELTQHYTTIFQCEINPFCQTILKKCWPDTIKYQDIKELKNPEHIDVLCGGFPCQNLSDVGDKTGLDGAKSSLWYEFARLIDEVYPQYVIIENVRGLVTRGLEHVIETISKIGYDCQWDCFPARLVGAPHKRNRVWIVAYSTGIRSYVHRQNKWSEEISGAEETVWNNDCHVFEAGYESYQRHRFHEWSEVPESFLTGISNGFPHRMDRTLALGNAVVPYAASLVGYGLYELHRCRHHLR